MQKILLAEDDPGIADLVSGALKSAGFDVQRFADGPSVWETGEVDHYDAIILDLGLPGMDGLSVLKRWRSAGVTTPVLVLTARGSWMERVDGFDAGADDYLPKPFRKEELLARLRALLRRASQQPSKSRSGGEFTIDETALRVTFRGEPLDVTPLEYRLIAFLIEHRGQIASPLQLASHVQGRDDEAAKNAIEAMIARLRKKTAANAIETRRGFGYMLPDQG